MVRPDARQPVLHDGHADRGIPIESAQFGKLVEFLVHSRLKPNAHPDPSLFVSQCEESSLLMLA